jgi:hypothetical protein
MKFTHCRCAAVLGAVVLLWMQPCVAAMDSIYTAGTLAGRTLYWVPIDPIAPDTLRWQSLQQALPVEDRDSSRSLAAVAAHLAAKGWSLYRLDKCTAMALALLQEQGVRCYVFDQWHAALGREVVLPRPGMPQKAMRHNLVSDYQWEEVERAAIEPPTGSMQDFRVSIHLAGAGYVDYWGRDLVTQDNKQLLGSEGLSVTIAEVSYHEDVNVRRKVFEVYMVVPAGTSPKAVVAQVEKGMDARKLDMSYKAPVPMKVQ